MTDFLDDKRKEIDNRLKELRPLVDEFQRLEQAAAALAGVKGNGATRRGPGRPPGSGRGKRAGASRRRRGRPRGSGTRSIQALEIVRARPGITIPELAQEMGIKQNYLYRVMPGLQKERKVTRKGKGWHAAGA